MEKTIKNIKYIIIHNEEIHPMKNYSQILNYINSMDPDVNLSAMLISRRFKEKNYFKFNDMIIKKLIW
tara:strand:- start:343 stop:546 length:204 start_codon:yes stop_codon:yes gene_type:complete